MTKRPHIKLDPADCLPLGGPAAIPDFAWNPRARASSQLYDAGKMAVIPAVDYRPRPVALPLARVLAGRRAGGRTGKRLAGRWIDQNGAADNPLQALSVDGRWTAR